MQNNNMASIRNASPIDMQENRMRPSFRSDVRMLQQYNMNILNNQSNMIKKENAYHVRNGIQSMSFNMVPEDHTHKFQHQEFNYFVVIDFEATCDKIKQPDPQEIIEFPSVLVNGITGQIEDCFQTYVRPTHHPILTDFCKELTGIQQTQVDGGVSISKALFSHDLWLRERGVNQTNFAILTWTNWDCSTMLESECKLKRIYKPAYFNRWINLKVAFHEIFGSVHCNLKEAVKLAGLTWEGRAHCGLEDARNTARLLVHLLHRGFKLSITDFLECPQTASDSRVNSIIKAEDRYCLCGVKSNMAMVRKPGLTQGKCFFGCGNWTPSRQGKCDYFIWAS